MNRDGCICRKSSNRLSRDKVSLRCDCGSAKDLAEVGCSNVSLPAVVRRQLGGKVIRYLGSYHLSGFLVATGYSAKLLIKQRTMGWF